MEVDKKQYGDYVKQITPVHSTFKNVLTAFAPGGVICTIGQILLNLFMDAADSDIIKRHSDRLKHIPENRKVRRSRGSCSYYRFCQLGGGSGNRV